MIDRRSKAVKWPLLALLAYLCISTALAFSLDLTALYYLAPPGFLQVFLLSWFDARLPLLVLSLLPLLGWLLLHRGSRPGKWIIVGVLCLLLAADVMIFVLHFITTLSAKNGSALGETVLLALACPIVCIPALVLTSLWYPKI